jgi:hypothetical protein
MRRESKKEILRRKSHEVNEESRREGKKSKEYKTGRRILSGL